AGTLVYSRAGLCLVFFWLLLGDVVFVLMDQLEPRVLPVVLKNQGATDTEIAIIVGSITYLLNFVVTPIVSYRSDRKRSRWGRRIPYLMWATPFVSLFLALTPLAPEITGWLMQSTTCRELFERLPVSSPVVAVYGALTVIYQVFHMVVASIYFYLFRDVVPVEFLGRFMALFRIFGAVGTFVLNYWLLGMATTHTREIFIGVAIAYGLGFLGMCYFVREGSYPPNDDTDRGESDGWSRGWLRACRTFVVESFSDPIYRWTYVACIAVGAMVPVHVFLVFFPRDELGLSLDEVGKLISWGALVWLPLALPAGWAMDRWGPTRILSYLLIGYIGVAAGSFFLINDRPSFFVSSLCLGAFFPGALLLLAISVLRQRIFHPERMGQLSAASAMLQALVVALMVSPGIGWMLDALQGFHMRMTVPWAGVVDVGRYRLLYLVLLVLGLLSLWGTRMSQRHWLRLGGTKNYRPPEPRALAARGQRG
ncbi:MAG: MFS transporter, partial [Opitutaceae bacterium]